MLLSSFQFTSKIPIRIFHRFDVNLFFIRKIVENRGDFGWKNSENGLHWLVYMFGGMFIPTRKIIRYNSEGGSTDS